MCTMERGVVRQFGVNKKNGKFGFITPDEPGVSVFFHINQGRIVVSRRDLPEPGLREGSLITPKAGDRLVFLSAELELGPRASIWAYESDWDRETIAAQQIHEPGKMGYCSYCLQEQPIIRIVQNGTDSSLPVNKRYRIVDHGRSRGNCMGSGKNPSQILEKAESS